MVDRNENVDDGENAGDGSGSGERSDGDGDDDVGENRIYHRKVTPDADEANRSLLRLLADVEGCEVTDLPPLYEQVDHLVEHLFTDPPPASAQAELEFSYHGYRVELDQTGNVSLMKLAEEPPEPEE